MICNIPLAVTTAFASDTFKYGSTLAVLIVVISMYCAPLNEYFATGEDFHCVEISQMVMATVINFGYCGIYIIVELDGGPEGRDEQMEVVFITFLLPILVSYGSAFYKWNVDSWEMKRFTVWALMVA